MQYEKPLIFIYPISDTLLNLKKAIEASGQPLDIYEIDDLRELLQTIPSLGQSLVIGSNAKKCAKFLQAAKKLIKQYDTKVVIISQKQYPRKTVDKLMKFGLNDIIFEPVPAKTLMYKVNLALRSLKVPSKKELEKKFKAEQAQKAKENGEDISLDEDGNDLENDAEGNENSKKFSSSDEEESEEELLASMQKQKSKRPGDEHGGFDPNDLDAGSTEQEVEKEYVDSGDGDEEDEEELLASMKNQKVQRNDDDMGGFDPNDLDAGSTEQEVEQDFIDGGSEEEENEEELLASMKNQKVQRADDEEGFDPNSLDAGNTEQAVDKTYMDEGGYDEDQEDEESLLADMPTKSNKNLVQEQDTDFNANELETTNRPQFEFDPNDPESVQGQEQNENDPDFDPFANQGEDDDDEEMISLADLAGSQNLPTDDEETVSLDDLMAGSEGATNVEGQAEEMQTHMEGQGSTEHIEDDEHEMSESEMEFEEMAALSEISNMNTKMKGQGGGSEAFDENMQGDVSGQESIDNTMAGDVYGQEDLDGNMQGDVYGDDEIDGNMVGDVSLDDLMEGGNLEGNGETDNIEEGNLEGHGQTDHLEEGNLAGDVLSKENNIKTHYDSEGINHQDQFEPNLEHSAENEEYGGNMEGDVYNTEDGLDDDMASLMADDVDLNDLTGEASVDPVSGNLEGDVYGTNENPDGGFEGLISEDPQAERLQGRGSTDQIQENDLEGDNHSLMGDQGGNMAGHQAGTDHIETNYNTNFAEEMEKKKKANPLMEFQHEEDYYGDANLAKPKKKSALDMHQSEDLYGQNHTRSLQEDKNKRATDDWSDQQKKNADTGFSEFDDPATRNAKLELPYELQEVEYDDAGKPVPKLELLTEDEKPKHPGLEMPYEMQSEWGPKRDGKLKAQYSLEELDELDKKRPKFEEPKVSIDEQYAIYDNVDINSLIDDFGSDEELGDEHVEELKEMAKSLQIQGSIYDDFEPEDYIKLEKHDPWDEQFTGEIPEREQQPLPDPINPEDALGLDTLVALSQLHQTVTMRPKDAIYASNKMFWQEHQCLTCSIQIDGGNVEEVYNAITDPIVSEDYLAPEEWNVIRTKTLQAAKKSSESFWQGGDGEGIPKIYFRPFFEDNIMFGGVVFYFPYGIEAEKEGLYEAYAESMKMLTYSSLPPSHSLKQKQAESENPVEKETIFGRMKGAYQETFVEEQVDQKTGKKGTKFGNWLKDKIEKIAS